MKTIVLSRGQVTFVDDEDFEYLTQWRWYMNTYGYATRCYMTEGKIKRLYLHRVVTEAPKGIFTDHIDGDRLNNQKGNLRLVNQKENSQNRKKGINNRSGYIGVSWDNYNKRWKAQGMFEGKQKFLGNFKDPVSAAKCRDEFVKTVYGSYAKLNFPN